MQIALKKNEISIKISIKINISITYFIFIFISQAYTSPFLLQQTASSHLHKLVNEKGSYYCIYYYYNVDF